MDANNQIQAVASLIHEKDRCYPLDTKLGRLRGGECYSEMKGLWVLDLLRTMKMDVAGAYGTYSYQTTRRYIPADHIRQKISARRGTKLDMSVIWLVAYYLSCPRTHRVKEMKKK